MGVLYVVATPIGNLSDITQRALDVLGAVDVVAAEDTRRTLGLLSHFGIRVSVVSNYKHNEQTRARQLIERMVNDGISVAVVSDAGAPCVSDPGCLLVEMAHGSGIKVVSVPGASAVTAALSVCGFNFNNFAFLGFIPRAKKEKDAFFNNITNSGFDTFVLFESPNRIVASLKEIAAAAPDCLVCVINDMTKLHEKTYRGGIDDVVKMLEGFPNVGLGEYTVVVHRVENLELSAENLDEGISVEGLLADEMAKNGLTLKESAAKLTADGRASRNETYKAVLNLKRMFDL